MMLMPPPITNPITPMMPTHTPTMRVTGKGIMFSREAATLLGAVPGTRISIEREPDPSHLYLYVKVVPTSGFVLFPQNRRLVAWSRSLARRILTLTECSRRQALYRLGDPTYDRIGHRIVPIITSIDYAERNQV